jgi:HSP20 family protein
MSNALTNGAGHDLAQAQAAYTPRVDVLETPEELVFQVDMPGVRPEDVDVCFAGGELTLQGRCQARGAGRLLRAEYGVGDYYRGFTVNEPVEADRISAELKQGVLTVRLPRSEASRPRKIAVMSE